MVIDSTIVRFEESNSCPPFRNLRCRARCSSPTACCWVPARATSIRACSRRMGSRSSAISTPSSSRLMDETQELLRYVFQTTNRLTLAISGTGSAGMETVVVNLIEPGDRMLVCINGVFGGRMKDVAERAGAEVTTIERPYGEVFDPDEVKAAIRARPAQGRRDRPRRDLDGCLAAGRGDRQDRPRGRGLDRARHRHRRWRAFRSRSTAGKSTRSTREPRNA